MDFDKIYKQLIQIIPKEKVILNEQMSKHTTFKVGGPAKIFVDIDNFTNLKESITILNKNKIPYKVIGNGSNILVKDEGYSGVILKISFANYKIKKIDNTFIINVESGVKLGMLAQKFLDYEIEGFEFASGIPGTIGGAIRMNAGAHGKEMKDIIKTVTILDENNEIKTIENNNCNFEYRNSIFSTKNWIIIEAEIELQKGNKEEIKSKMDEYKKYRIEKQPIEYPSAGSTFKRGKDFITAKLIDDAGLKGYSIGGAEVSTKQAGFIINKNNATAQDIINLIQEVQKIIYKKYKKKIETEVEII